MTEAFRALLAAIFPGSPTLWLRLILYWFVTKLAITLETHIEEFESNPHSRAWFEAGIAYAEDGIALLTGQRTRVLMDRRFRLIRPWRKIQPSANPPSFDRLMQRYARMLVSLHDIERIARRRAERLLAECAENPLHLAAPHQSTSPTLRVVEATHRSLASTSPQDWGRWIARPCAQDGGGRASARGPPPIPIAHRQLRIA